MISGYGTGEQARSPPSNTSASPSPCYGFLLFAELPDLCTLLGASIIVASTVYIARREQLRNRQRQTGGPSALG